MRCVRCCEIEPGEHLDGGRGFDTSRLPVPVPEAKAAGITLLPTSRRSSSSRRCRSSACLRPTVPVTASCAEGRQPAEVRCECERGWAGSTANGASVRRVSPAGLDVDLSTSAADRSPDDASGRSRRRSARGSTGAARRLANRARCYRRRGSRRAHPGVVLRARLEPRAEPATHPGRSRRRRCQDVALRACARTSPTLSDKRKLHRCNFCSTSSKMPVAASTTGRALRRSSPADAPADALQDLSPIHASNQLPPDESSRPRSTSAGAATSDHDRLRLCGPRAAQRRVYTRADHRSLGPAQAR